MVKLNKDLKRKVEILIKAEGKEYNEWLNKKHEEYISKNENKIWKIAEKVLKEYDKVEENKIEENKTEEIENEESNY